MPSFQGIVKDEEIAALVAFIKSQNPDYKGSDPELQTGPVSSDDPGPVGVGRDDQGQETPSPEEQPDSERLDPTPERTEP